MGTTIEVNNELISWAISRAGYKLKDIPELYPRAKDWLDDKKEPTLPQLRDFARKVHLPFGYLLLNEPPIEELPIPFFRTLGGATDQVDLNVRDTILTLQKRQDWMREYLIEQGRDPLEWVGGFTTDTPVDVITKDIRRVLNLNYRWANHLPNWQQALDHLAEKVEDAGIIIVFNSVVGNNTHRSIDVEDCRGFVLTDEYAPFLFVNSADSKSAQMFTIVHELAHIWIGESAGFDFRQLQPAENEIERFCDQLAAEFLVPSQTFEEAWTHYQDNPHIGEVFEALARQFKVSPIVIGRRALDLGKIHREEFFEFYNHRIQQHFAKRESQSDGGNFYATLRKRLNQSFVATVNRAVKEDKLLYKDAYELTGLKGTTYEKAINKFGL